MISNLSSDNDHPSVPRIESLLHRLQHAKDTDGQPLPLLDELLFFLDDPPPGTGDRWQKGAELCAEHGIQTSRMSVWRLYRARILQWRREQNPPPPVPVNPDDIERLHDQARLIAAQRAIDLLNDPRLSVGNLIAILQNHNRRDQLELGHEQLAERVLSREHKEQLEQFLREQKRRREEEAFETRWPSKNNSARASFPVPAPLPYHLITPHNETSRPPFPIQLCSFSS